MDASKAQPARPLQRILGVGFGLAIGVGGTVGVGILRLPGTVAMSLGDSRLIIAFWILGGLYAMLGAVSVAELAALFPQAGGFRVYARQAFGDGAGFTIGWCDWLCLISSLAYGAIAASTFLGSLWPLAAAHAQLTAIGIVGILTLMHTFGIRMGSTLTNIISLTIGLMLTSLVIGCFFVPPVSAAAAAPLSGAAASLPWMSGSMLVAVVTALRAVLVTYDGWYSPIYLAEENTDPTRTLPRAIIGGAVLVTGLYVAVNFALLRVLPLSVLARSPLPAADAARAILPNGGVQFVTLISLATALSLINASLLMAPRILFGLARDGHLFAAATSVSRSGTPRPALVICFVATIALILTGTFEQITSLAAVLFLLCYISAYAAVIRLRKTQPHLPRPYRAFGYPVATGIALLGSTLFLVAAVAEDSRSAWIAAAFLVFLAIAYRWLRRLRRSQKPA